MSSLAASTSIRSPRTSSSVASLRSRATACIGDLRTLNEAHLKLDPPDGQFGESEKDLAIRLRKVFYHVRAMAQWPVDMLTLHLVAPDARAALGQLGPMVRGIVGEGFKDGAGRLVPLEQFCHPSPQQLVQGLDRGGFSETDEVLYCVRLHGMLAGLAVSYGLCLATLADASGR